MWNRPMNAKTLALLVAISVLPGCSTTPEADAVATANEVRCEKYTPTGSRIPTTRCLTSEQMEREREKGQEFLRNRTTPNPTPGN